jgi:hypothetical protein
VVRVYGFLERALKIIGLYKQGYRNALNLQIRFHEIKLPSLPKAFEGMKVLFLSDLHLGKMEEMPDIILRNIKDMEVDVCIFGGDFRYSKSNPDLPYLESLEKIVSSVSADYGIYGVLGNHDSLEMVPQLEKLGIKILINESVLLKKDGEILNLVGLDSTYGDLDNIDRAFKGVSDSEFIIFVSHYPDFYKEAEQYGSNIYICGHTHHGQIQFPIIGPIITMTSAPRSFATGAWEYKGMFGLTGSGVGTVGINVRFLCLPEIIVLTLRQKNKEIAA